MLRSEKEHPAEGRHTEKPCGSLPGVPATSLGEWEQGLGHTDAQLAATATAHAAEPFQRKAKTCGESETGRARHSAKPSLATLLSAMGRKILPLLQN